LAGIHLLKAQFSSTFDILYDYQQGQEGVISISKINNGYWISGAESYFDSTGVYKLGGVFVARISESGNIYATKHYMDNTRIMYAGHNGSMIMLSDSSFAICGTASRGNSQAKILFFRFNLAGDTLYTKELGLGTLNVGNICRRGRNGDFYLAGYCKFPNNPNADFYIAKLDSLGNVCWEKNIYFTGNDECYSLDLDSEDNLYLSGNSTTFSSGPQNSGNPLVVKLDSAGNYKWHKVLSYADHTYPLASLSFLQVLDDNSIIAGSVLRNVNYFGFALITMLDSTGDFTWQKPIGGFGSRPALISFSPSGDGNIIASGYTSPIMAPEIQIGWIFKMSMDGDSLWSRKYWNPTFDTQSFLLDHVVSEDGSITSAGWGNFPQNGWVLKVDSSGCMETDSCGLLEIDVSVDAVFTPHPFRIYPNPGKGVFQVDIPVQFTGAPQASARKYPQRFKDPMLPGSGFPFFLSDTTETAFKTTQVQAVDSTPNKLSEITTESALPLRVYDYQGRLVHTGNIAQAGGLLNIEHLPEGIYIVQAGTGAGVYSVKVIIRKE